MKPCLPPYLPLVWILCTSACFGQPQASPSHRIIPSASQARRPNVEEVVPAEVLELWQDIETDIGQRGPRGHTPQMTTRPNPEEQYLPADTAELVQRMSRNLGRSLVEALNTDISEFSAEASGELERQGTIKRDDSRLPEQLQLRPADVDRNLQQALEMISEHREAFQQAVREYQQTWPQDSIAPQTWLRKVQPFINQQMLTQLRKMAQDLDTQKSRSERKAPEPRPQERTAAAANSLNEESKPRPTHSNAVVGSMLKALDTRSTKLFKSAATQPRRNSDSWWKRWQQDTRDQLKSWNQQLTEQSRQIVDQRSELAQPSGIGWPQQPSLSWSQSSTFWPLLPAALAVGVLGYWLGIHRRRRITQSWRPPPEPGSILDAQSFLAALHHLCAHHFGMRCQFWNHRQLMGQLGDVSELSPDTIGQLSAWYERARYANDRTTWNADELRSVQELFSVIRDRCWGTS